MRKVAVLLVCALALSLGIAARPAVAATTTEELHAESAAPAAPCGTLGVPTTTIFLPNITKMLGGPDGWVTPFIVQNVGVKKATLEVSFFRFSDGGLVTCRRIDDLAPGTSFADYPNNDVDLPSDAQFSVVVKSFGSEVVSVVNEHQSQRQPARAEALSYNGLTSGATSVYLPFVGSRIGTCPPRCQLQPQLGHDLVMQNFGAVNTTVSARFTSSRHLHRDCHAHDRPGRSRFIDPTTSRAPRGRYYSVVLIPPADRRRRERT